MASIDMALSLSSARKRLTRAAPGPALSAFRPASESEGVRPSSDPGEEMALHESSEIVWLNKFD